MSYRDEVARLMEGYDGDEEYPDDDHSLGFHEDDPDPDCRECRREARRRRAEEDD